MNVWFWNFANAGDGGLKVIGHGFYAQASAIRKILKVSKSIFNGRLGQEIELT